MEIEDRTNCPLRPGESIDWEFERFWLVLSPKWPEAFKEKTRWFFALGRLRYEDFPK